MWLNKHEILKTFLTIKNYPNLSAVLLKCGKVAYYK